MNIQTYDVIKLFCLSFAFFKLITIYHLLILLIGYQACNQLPYLLLPSLIFMSTGVFGIELQGRLLFLNIFSTSFNNGLVLKGRIYSNWEQIFPFKNSP